MIDEQDLLDNSEIKISYIHASGPGGQNINKVNSAVRLNFNIYSSTSLDEESRHKLIKLQDSRIDKKGTITILARRFRNREMNRQDAIKRLVTLIQNALQTAPVRVPTHPTSSSKQKRVEMKLHRASLKKTRRKIFGEE